MYYGYRSGEIAPDLVRVYPNLPKLIQSEMIMDNASVVSSFAQAGDVLVGGADMISGTGKQQNTVESKRGRSLAYVAALGVASGSIASPKGEEAKELVTLYHPEKDCPVEYTTSDSGRVICTFVDVEGNPFVPPTMQFTKQQVFDAIKLSVVEGIPAGQRQAWLAHQRGEVIPPHLAHEVSPASRKVSSRMSDWKKALLSREGETIMDQLQDEENDRAALAGEKPKDVRKVAKEKAAQDKRDAENAEKPARDVGSECAITAIRRLTKDENPADYDHAGAIAAFRTALVCLNVEDPTLNPDDPDNE